MFKCLNLFYLPLAILCISCQYETRETKHFINVEFNKSYSYHKASQIFDSEYMMVQLDAPTNQSVIKRIERILFAGDNIVVVDRLGNKLLIFDRTGKFVTSTSKYIGRGHNEYIRLLDAALDEKGQRIYVYCDAPYQIMVFDYNLNLIDCTSLDFLAFEIAVDSTYVYLTRYDESGERKFDLVAIDKENLQMKPHLICKGVQGVRGLNGIGKSLNMSNGYVYFNVPFKYDIYKIKSAQIIETFAMDFGNKEVTDIETKELRPSEFISEYPKHIWSLQNFCVTDSVIMYRANTPHYFFINTKNDECIVYDEILNDVLPIFNSMTIPTQGKKGAIVYEARPELIERFLNHMKADNHPKSYDSEIELVKNYTLASNPLIIEWKLKNTL